VTLSHTASENDKRRSTNLKNARENNNFNSFRVAIIHTRRREAAITG